MASSFNSRLAQILLKETNLKSCKAIKFKFNPWFEETKSVRDVYSHLYSPRYRETNLKCALSADIRSDNCSPEIEVVFNDDSKAIFKTQALTTYDIIKEFNKLSKQKAPKETAAE